MPAQVVYLGCFRHVCEGCHVYGQVDQVRYTSPPAFTDTMCRWRVICIGMLVKIG